MDKAPECDSFSYDASRSWGVPMGESADPVDSPVESEGKCKKAKAPSALLQERSSGGCRSAAVGIAPG